MEIDLRNPPEGQRGTCPRCKKESLWVGVNKAFNALSRKDNETYICHPCGSEQAAIDFADYLRK